VFGALVQGQTGKAPQPQAKPASTKLSPPPVTSRSTVSTGTASNATLQERSFFVKDPLLDAAILSTMAPKSSDTKSSSSSSDLTNTLLLASVLNNNGNNGNNNNQRPSSRRNPRYRGSSQPQYAPPQFAQPPQYVQASVSTQFSAPPPQPQYFAPAPQPQYAPAPQPQYAPAPQYAQRGYQDSYGYDSHYDTQREDPLKKMVLLSGVTSGKVNPLAAVAMDNNKGMSTTDAVVISSLGNSPTSTLLAMSGGLGGGSSSGGSMFGGNALATLAVAGALTPQKDSKDTSSSSTNMLTTLATLSVLNRNNGAGSNGGNYFGN